MKNSKFTMFVVPALLIAGALTTNVYALSTSLDTSTVMMNGSSNTSTMTTTNTAPTNSSMMMKMDMMSSGSQGKGVVWLQDFLGEKGHLKMSSNSKKGYFGYKTRMALKSFQRANELPVTGKYDKKTDAFIQSMNMKMSAGVMVGGQLMVANQDIVENAVRANNVTTVVAAVKAAGLVDTLKSAGPFTVFAPNNAAFEKLPAGTVATLLLPENKAKLVDILTYHVVPGKYKAADLTDGKMLTTVEGKTLKFTRVNGKIMINGSAMVETPDVISRNGVTFVIDTVLMPQ